MTRGAQEIILILSAEHAMTIRVAMTVGAATAQRQSGRGDRRQRRRKNNYAKQSSRKLFHVDLPFSHEAVASAFDFRTSAGARLDAREISVIFGSLAHQIVVTRRAEVTGPPPFASMRRQASRKGSSTTSM